MKIFTAAFLLVAILLTGCGLQENDSKNSIDMKYKKVFIVGFDEEFAPMTFRDASGNIVGFDIDLANETAKRMSVKFEFKPINWNDKEREITSGNIDMIWSGCDLIDEYKEYMLFGKPYMDNRQVILVRATDDQGIHAKGDLAGKIVGTQAGSNAESYIDGNETLKSSFREFKTYNNFKEAMEALKAADLDALIIDEIAGRYESMTNPDTFKIVEITVGPVTEFAIAFRKDDVELRDRVQKVFDEIIHDGTAKQISEKWFQADIIKYR